ncbi:MAG: hypothetical protein ACREOC_07685 [Gemmatimonadales bacterium]
MAEQTGLLVALAFVLVAACREETGRLGPERDARFAAESLLHRADDLETHRSGRAP